MKGSYLGIFFLLFSGIGFGQQKARKELLLTQYMAGSYDNIEQAMLSETSKTCRQRMFHLYLQDDSILVSQLFEFKDPSLYIVWGPRLPASTHLNLLCLVTGWVTKCIFGKQIWLA